MAGGVSQGLVRCGLEQSSEFDNCLCTLEYQPWCAEDGLVYPNQCTASKCETQMPLYACSIDFLGTQAQFQADLAACEATCASKVGGGGGLRAGAEQRAEVGGVCVCRGSSRACSASLLRRRACAPPSSTLRAAQTGRWLPTLVLRPSAARRRLCSAVTSTLGIRISATTMRFKSARSSAWSR